MKQHYYRVTFDTQRNRLYTTWGFYVLAFNQKEAKNAAYECWHNANNPRFRERGKDESYAYRPHMFHVTAERVTSSEITVANGDGIDLSTFYVIDMRNVTWGRRG